MTKFGLGHPVAGPPKGQYGKSMTANHGPGKIALSRAVLLLLLVAASQAPADQIEMQNGDHYVGRLVALTNDMLVVQSELLGTVRLPRSKVVSITLAPTTATNLTRLPAQTNRQYVAAAPVTNASSDVSAGLRQMGANTNFIQQVREQFLSAAGPEANSKFNELVGGLMSGKLDVNDIRAEAASAANQIRALKRDLGDDAGWAMDGYLAILDTFLRETASPTGSSAKAADPVRKPKNVPVKEAE